MKKTYLGDGVYVEPVNHGILLTTDNGVTVTNRIVLEWDVISALELYLRRQAAEQESNIPISHSK